MKRNYYTYEQEGERFTADLSDLELWPFFRTVAAEIAMSDCSEVRVNKIVYQDKEFKYTGWQPGMRFTFISQDGTEEYTTYMPEYDH